MAKKYHTRIPWQPVKLPLRLANDTCDDGLVQVVLRQDKSFCFVHDTLELWHLHCSLSCSCKLWLHAENVHRTAASSRIFYNDRCCVYFASTDVRNFASHSVYSLVRTWRKEGKRQKQIELIQKMPTANDGHFILILLLCFASLDEITYSGACKQYSRYGKKHLGEWPVAYQKMYA